MDESFTRWRGGEEPSSKSTNGRISFVISDSEDDSDISITSNDRRKVVIETSEAEDDTNDFDNTRSSEAEGNNRHSLAQSNKFPANHSKSNNNSIRDPDDYSSSEELVIRKKPVRKRMIFDDSESDTTHHSIELESEADVTHHSVEGDSEADETHYSKDQDSEADETHYSKDQDSVAEETHYSKNQDSEADETHYSKDQDSEADVTHHSVAEESEADITHHSVEEDSESDEPHQSTQEDSEEDITGRLKERDPQNRIDSDLSNSNSNSIIMVDSHREDRRSRSTFEETASAPSSVQEEIRAGKAEIQNRSCLTISDTSDVDDTSGIIDPSHNFDLASGTGTSDSLTSTLNSEDDASVVMSFVKKEIGVGNIDPFIAQQRAILTCNIQQVRSQLAKSRMLLNTANISLLPDKGEKLRRSANAQAAELAKLSAQLESLPKLGTPKPQPKPERKTIEPFDHVPVPPWKGLPGPNGAKALGQKALETQERELTLTEDRLKDLHGSLNARPSEDERAEDPRGLKVSLMPHQQHALAWLLWRERQRPHGGILADDMGLGKTLTMISLIIKTISNDDSNDDSEDSDDEWVHRKKSVHPKGGTLVVCPASVLSQWEGEINKRVRRGMLSVELFHGIRRETMPRRLAKNDVVITTYNLLSREYNKGDSASILHEINWRRVILDEAHIVRNHKSQASEAVCGLNARCRWALTGTPIQNKELDLYALLKFLKCSPFDDIRVWKRWVDNKNAHGHERLATVMKTLMLRRTKQELQAKGGLQTLPDKNLEEIHIKLDSDEQLVYEKVLVFSRTLFAQFLHQRAEKDHMSQLHAGQFDAPTFLQMPKDTQFTKVQNQLLARHADVKAHEILVLLLRLRQVCCHPALIHAMLDQEDLKGNEIVGEGDLNVDLMSGLETLNLEDSENIDPNEIGVDRRVIGNLLTTQNPVFNPKRQSSKMRAVLSTIQEILDKGDKLVVVSQWTSMLDVVQSHLESLNGATYDVLSGKVPVKNRQHIVESFNKVGSAPQILLLSLTAGGVGLNLVGGNHLLLLDIHWNPQLEAQAQDRIFRVGQTKSVYIYKFICLDTVEQRIKALQDKKLAIAQGVLTGAGTAGAAKLTLDDLKSLFSF